MQKKRIIFAWTIFQRVMSVTIFSLFGHFSGLSTKKIYQPELLTVSCKYNSEIFVFLFFSWNLLFTRTKNQHLKNQNYFIIIYSELFKILLFSRWKNVIFLKNIFLLNLLFTQSTGQNRSPGRGGLNSAWFWELGV